MKKNETNREFSKRSYHMDAFYAKIRDSRWNWLYKVAGIAAFVALATFIISMIFIMTINVSSANDYFTLLQNNRLIGLFRFYFTDMIGMALFFPMYLGLYIALKRYNKTYATLAAILAFTGLIFWFVIATHSAFSMINLSDQYATAITDIQKSQLLNAGEMVIASDMWNGTGGTIAGILIQTAAIIISILMLKSKIFNKTTAYIGILGNGLDFIRIIFHIFISGISNIIMAVAGPLQFIWIFLLARRLLQLGHQEKNKNNSKNRGKSL